MISPKEKAMEYLSSLRYAPIDSSITEAIDIALQAQAEKMFNTLDLYKEQEDEEAVWIITEEDMKEIKGEFLSGGEK